METRTLSLSSYELQAIKCLWLLTKPETLFCSEDFIEEEEQQPTHAKSTKGIWTRLLDARWKHYYKYSTLAVLRGWLRKSEHRFPVDKSCRTWTWTPEAGAYLDKIEITDKRLLKILSKQEVEPKWYHLWLSKKRRDQHSTPLCPSPDLLAYNKGYDTKIRATNDGRFISEVINMENKTSGSRKKYLETRWQESSVVLDQQNAHLMLLCHTWKHLPGLEQDCQKILRECDTIIPRIQIDLGFSLDKAKHHLRALIGEKNPSHANLWWTKISQWFQTNFPGFYAHLSECRQKAFRNKNFLYPFQVATRAETKLWRLPGGIENRFLLLCDSHGLCPKFLDEHDGVSVAMSQQDIMQQAIKEVCEEQGFPKGTIRTKYEI